MHTGSMDMVAAHRRCSACDAEVASDAPEGLCSKCLLSLGMDPDKTTIIGDPSYDADPGVINSTGLLPETKFGDYELQDEIARGGMGVVFRARQISLNRTVALKMILDGRLASPGMLERFHNEAEAAAALDHPNIVPIYEVGEHGGRSYFSMKLVSGGSLAEMSSRGDVTPQRAARMMVKVARAVHYAHQRGVLHRDLKPNNVLIDRHGEPHLTDFGLAKLAVRDSRLTHTQSIMGTPSYMSPEQAAGGTRHSTITSDIYSLGAIFYDLLTGHPPFEGPTAMETLRKVTEEEPKRPRAYNRAIDIDIETICLKCLEKDPARRYESAEDLAEDLERWLRNEPISARPASAVHRFRRWMRRNPVPSVAMAVLMIALAILSVLYHNIYVQKEDMDRVAEVSRREFAKAMRDLWDASSEYVPVTSEARAIVAKRPLPPTAAWRVSVGIRTYHRPDAVASDFNLILHKLEEEFLKEVGQAVCIDLRIYRNHMIGMKDLLSGDLDFMRVGPPIYVMSREKFPEVTLIASELMEGDYVGAVFTRADLDISSIENLRGRTFAFGNSTSYFGNFAPKAALAGAGLHQKDFKERHAFLTNAEVVDAVSRGLFDAGAARLSSVQRNPQLKVLLPLTLQNVGHAWIRREKLDPQLAESFKRALLAIQNPAILRKMEEGAVGFIDADDALYDQTRQVVKRAEEFGKGPID